MCRNYCFVAFSVKHTTIIVGLYGVCGVLTINALYTYIKIHSKVLSMIILYDMAHDDSPQPGNSKVGL